jgi:putative DNA primase/helicase
MQPKAPSGFRVYAGTSNGQTLEVGIQTSSPPWPKPSPLVGEIEREPYPVNALPDAIRAVVEEVQAEVQAPAEMVACSALSVASLAAQSMADVARSKTLPGPCSLYFLTVAESGDRKSTVDRLLGRAIREFQDQQCDASKITLASHEADIAAWRAKHDAADSKMQGDAKAGKDIEGHRADLAQLEGDKPQPQRIPRLIFEDVTCERLGKSLATEWPSGGVFSSEGGAVLGGHSMGKDSLTRTLSLLNKLWDGAAHVVDRQTAASFAVRGARMTISLQVQPHVLADFLDRDRGLSRGSGFLARFLPCQPVSLQGTRFYREATDMPALAQFSARIGEMLNDLPRIDGDRGMVLPTLDFEPTAKAYWVETFDAIEGELTSGGDFASIRDVASKAGDNIARLAAVLHLFEHGPVGLIALRSVESAAQIVLWHLYAAKGLFAPFSLSREAANAVTLDRWLIDRAQMEGVVEFSTRTILNGGPNATRRRDALEDALKILALHGRARLVESGRRRLVTINPALLNGTAAELGEDAPDIDMPAARPQGWN